jgi:hypothetical protein
VKRKARIRRRGIEASNRKRPPFAQNSKDGATSSTGVVGTNREKPGKYQEKGEEKTYTEITENAESTEKREPGEKKNRIVRS